LAGSSIGTVGAQNNDLKNGDGKQSTSLSVPIYIFHIFFIVYYYEYSNNFINNLILNRLTLDSLSI